MASQIRTDRTICPCVIPNSPLLGPPPPALPLPHDLLYGFALRKEFWFPLILPASLSLIPPAAKKKKN